MLAAKATQRQFVLASAGDQAHATLHARLAELGAKNLRDEGGILRCSFGSLMAHC